jgi:serine/threonine-protein kinase SRPK3
MILSKLGWGHFSTVWLAMSLRDKKLYALKIQKSAKKYTESAEEEMLILQRIAEKCQDEEWIKSLRVYLD